MNYIDHIKGYLSRAALLLLMAGGALMAGCEDFLVRDVPNQTTDEEWWQNKGQLNTALNNLYKPMPSGTITYVNHDVKQSQASGYPNARVEMEALTDNGVGSANYVSYNAFTAGITSSSEDVCNKIWNMKWTVIRRCCRFMEHYQQATVAPTRRRTKASRPSTVSPPRRVRSGRSTIWSSSSSSAIFRSSTTRRCRPSSSSCAVRSRRSSTGSPASWRVRRTTCRSCRRPSRSAGAGRRAPAMRGCPTSISMSATGPMPRSGPRR